MAVSSGALSLFVLIEIAFPAPTTRLRLGQSKAMYNGWQFVHDSASFSSLTPAQQRITKEVLTGMKLSGIGLEGEDKTRFNEIKTKLAKLSTEFSNGVQDAVKAFSHVITEKEKVKGLPESALALAAQTYRNKEKERREKALKDEGKEGDEAKLKDGDIVATAEDGPWEMTLDHPSYLPVMQYAEDRELRAKIYKAFLTRASEFQDYGEGGDLGNYVLRGDSRGK